MNLEIFNETVIKPSYSRPVLVDFWADWCDPCKLLDPILTELAKENEGDWGLVKIDLDQSPELKSEYDLMGVPAIRIFHKGEIIAKYNGLMWKKDMARWIGQAIGSAN